MTTHHHHRAARTRGLVAAGLAALALGTTADAHAAPLISATYGQTGQRTVSVTTAITGHPARSYALAETKRFSGTRAGRAITLRKVLPRHGRITLKVPIPRQASAVTARVRVVTLRKRRGKAAAVRTLARGRWVTLQLTDERPAPVARVASAQVAAVTPPSPSAPGALVVTGGSVRPGQVVALGITDKTPAGLLARVTAVAPAPGGVAATIVPASLPEVVPSGQFDVNVAPDVIQRAGARAEKAPRALECTSGRTATASVAADLSSGVRVSAGWSGGRLLPFRRPNLHADVDGTVRATLEGELALNGQAECTLTPQNLFPSPVRLAAFTVFVGAIPIPIVVDGQVTLTGSARANGSLSAGVRAVAAAEAGVSYRDGRLTPRSRFTRGFTHTPPAVNGTGTAELAISPTVAVRLAGTAGPVFDLTAGLKLDGRLDPAPGEPWWKLTAPVSMGARFSFALWGHEVSGDRHEIWKEEHLVAQADLASRPPGSTIVDQGTSPEPLPEGVRTRLTWDSDTDVDLHTWNQHGDHAYYADREAIPGGYLDQDVIPGYGPETFYETDRSLGNAFTFGVCQFSGENANVTVDVRDPDGTTRRYLVTLRGRKAAALLTTSPNGIAPYVDPERDWCSDGDDPEDLGQTTTGSFD